MKWIRDTKALLKCLTDADGIRVPGWGCADCPFSKPTKGEEHPNPSDPDEGYYDCDLIDEDRIWGEEPKCAEEDWAREIQHEVEAIEKRYEILSGACWLVWSNEHAAWWGPHRSGYYTDISAAGRYTYAQAMEICGLRSPGSELPPELIQPSPELSDFLAKI